MGSHCDPPPPARPDLRIMKIITYSIERIIFNTRLKEQANTPTKN